MPKLSDEELLLLLQKIATSSDDTFRSVVSLDKKLDLHIQKTEYELQRINEMDVIQNNLLDEHIAGVNTLKSIHDRYVEDNNKRFETLEAPRKWLKGSVKIIATIGAVCSGAVGIFKAFHLF